MSVTWGDVVLLWAWMVVLVAIRVTTPPPANGLTALVALVGLVTLARWWWRINVLV